MDFFKINGKTIRQPKDIGHSYEMLDKVERTMNGTMVVDIIGKKKKIDVSWDYLRKEDMKVLMDELNKDSFSIITFNNAETDTIDSITVKFTECQYNVGYDWPSKKVIWKNVVLYCEEK